jgi:hypothetical protein
MQDIEIFSAAAYLRDESAMGKLIAQAPEPYAGQLRDSLKPGASGRAFHFHGESRSARLTVCNGDMVMIFTVTNVSREEAAALAKECDSIHEWGEPSFQQAVRRALNVKMKPVQ